MINFEIIGQNSNKVNLKETEMTMRIIDAYSKDLTQEETIKIQLSGLKLRMANYLNNNTNSTIVNTGEFLNQLLKIYKIKKNKFAKHIEIEEPNLHALIKGRRKINNKIAKKLEMIFKIDAQIWMFIETKNEVKKFDKLNSLSNKSFSINELTQ